ncbi:hypothetical protein [Pseudomonas sp. LF19]|uniref:hypothetical protein n=1 Tax=Pseudomonas sp. LF19 TaxID=2899115 RepID=UPI001F44EFEC|nr:hypothetical protein [Pseudomonas sp. LF19]MCE5984850.1 hypothetical protein [Pseudomonas sp. LF19]
MSNYYHEIDRLDFQYQIASISKELLFRTTELIEASRRELSIFHKAIASRTPTAFANSGIVPYRFSSLLALIQTFRDALPQALGQEVEISLSSDDIPHASLIRQLRNALVHDGYQPITLWAEGRYYLPANFIRHDQKARPVKIDAPALDVETLSLQYFEKYCAQLSCTLKKLPIKIKLRGPQRSYDWFKAAWTHPVLIKFQNVEMPSRADWPEHPETEPAPLDLAATTLLEISQLCTARLKEPENLPDIPFP